MLEGRTEPVGTEADGVVFDTQSHSGKEPSTWPDVAKTRDRLQRAMTDGAGVVRDAESLARAGSTIDAVADSMESSAIGDRAAGELANLVTAARSVLRSASMRQETRGAHARSDFPEMSEAWRCRIVHGNDGNDASTTLVRTPPDPTDHPTEGASI